MQIGGDFVEISKKRIVSDFGNAAFNSATFYRNVLRILFPSLYSRYIRYLAD